ncbi:hypothetical protein O6H91_16G090000 [Diphasiastrum complanatum]|uniref:Uncharacterized protein n=2 Tax=Diphasiastrum complanatum TaxID=34168 RepID=A0ACC2BEJ0_DIPCM|nr:hypothetical protein O6H91_Y162900 [Diphasiastrum complanatum]KAJ7528214.1 hypothetical protein O6H91_16G090000 [Diphasiastrum complanatum]KAJ7528215.1 hypothetical protein O6H91_16G090000 [Diphasiastrum complanatum]
MDLAAQDQTHLAMPNPASSYGVFHESTKPRVSSSSNGMPSDELIKLKSSVRYRECLKNHAASIGGHATDGCGEFMPSGEEGTMEALKCAACDCHRNFHRREDPSLSCLQAPSKDGVTREDEQPNPTHISVALPTSSIVNLQRQPMIIPWNNHRQIDEDDQDGPQVYSLPESPTRKRFRTKFSADQKEKMWAFAEKIGWRIKKEDEAAVQQFCANVGVKRHVLKVWMHNNKQTYGKKPLLSPSPPHVVPVSNIQLPTSSHDLDP